MRTVRLAAAAVLMTAALGAVPSHADDDGSGSGSWLYLAPSIRRTTVDFTSWAAANKGLWDYTAHFRIDRQVFSDNAWSGYGDTWTQQVGSPGAAKKQHHVYTVAGATDAVFVYTAEMFAPGGTSPVLTCQSVLTFHESDAPEIRGTC